MAIKLIKMTELASHKKLAIKAAIEQGLLGEKKPLLVLVNQQGIIDSVNKLHDAFPRHFKHCFAVKANPYLKILQQLKQAGMGAEVASLAELELSLNAGFNPNQMVFDAPLKTPQEIERALTLGIAFNIDNFQELELVISCLSKKESSSNIGFRINPQIGAGKVASTSTATMTSKFGIGLKDKGNRQRIIDSCIKFPWLNTLHVHVGSIGCSLELMSEGISSIVELAEEINQTNHTKQIVNLDIGGGLPVDFTQDTDSPEFTDFAIALSKNVPQVMNGEYHITTEYGRAMIAKNAMTLGRIEYTKTMGGLPIALSHIGVQTLLRTVNEPEDWKRRITAFDKNGLPKEGKLIEQDIAGPACFTGDIIAHKRPLPLLQSGDYIMVHDTGAYQFSSHYQYNALPRLPVYGYSINDNLEISFEMISAGQTIDDVIQSFS
jgi:diaminopimelate decarboxylase